jgi:hypothetical protein
MEPLNEITDKFIMSSIDDVLFLMQKYRETKEEINFDKADALLKATKVYLMIKEWYRD